MTDRVPLTGEQVAPWLLTRAKSALENWGRHHRWCSSLGMTSVPCSCGLDAMIRDLTPTELPPESERLDPLLMRMALRAAWSESAELRAEAERLTKERDEALSAFSGLKRVLEIALRSPPPEGR